MQKEVEWIRSPPTSARRSTRGVHQDILLNAASQLKPLSDDGDLLAFSAAVGHSHNLQAPPPRCSAAARSPSPAPFEPRVPMSRPSPCKKHPSQEDCCDRSYTKLLKKLELEATALQNQLPNSLVTRAALQDAMRVLDENRDLKQQLSSAEGRLVAREQQDQAFKEAMARRDHEQDLVVATLQEEIAHLQHSRHCLREERNMLRRHCYLLSDAPQDRCMTQEGLVSVCSKFGIQNSAQLESILMSYFSAGNQGFGLMRTPSCVLDKGAWSQPAISAIPASHVAMHSHSKEQLAGAQRMHDSYTSQESQESRGFEGRQSQGGEASTRNFILKSRVEPYEGPWPKDSASPMVLPLDAESQISGSVDISRLPSMDDCGSHDTCSRFLQKGAPSKPVSGSLKLPTIDSVEVELSDDTDDDVSPRSPSAGSFKESMAEVKVPWLDVDTPLSTSTTVLQLPLDLSGEGEDRSPLIQAADENAAAPDGNVVLDSRGSVMWRGRSDTAGATQTPQSSPEDQPHNKLTSSRGLDLKRGKPSAVWSVASSPSAGRIPMTDDTQEPELRRVFLQMQERKKATSQRPSSMGLS